MVCCVIGTVALACGLTIYGEGGWAKHRESEPHSIEPSDSCAPLNTYIQKQISILKALKAAIEAEKYQAPKTLEGVFEGLVGQTVVDNEELAKLATARREAESLNSLLRIQGCKMVDIDQELAKP
jgi:hypothetical protein